MRGTLIAAIVAVIALAVPASAQQLQGVTFPTARIAFFDAERVVAESVTGQAAFAALDAFRTEAATDLERRNQALAADQQRLQVEAVALSETARLELERLIQHTELDIQRLLRRSAGRVSRAPAGSRVRLTGEAPADRRGGRPRAGCAFRVQPDRTANHLGRSDLRPH